LRNRGKAAEKEVGYGEESETVYALIGICAEDYSCSEWRSSGGHAEGTGNDKLKPYDVASMAIGRGGRKDICDGYFSTGPEWM